MSSDDVAAIEQLIADADRLQGDVEQFTALLTEDVVIVNIAGIRVAGREEFRAAMSRAMESRLANVRTRTEVDEIMFLRPDVALVGAVKQVFDENPAATGQLPSSGRMTFVVVRDQNAWRIASAQTTPIAT